MSQEISQVRERINGLVNEIHNTVMEIMDMADEYSTKSDVSEKTLKREFYPLFNSLKEKAIELMTLLKPYGVKDRDIRYIVRAIEELKTFSTLVPDPDKYDYFVSGVRFVESIIALVNGETPYFGNGDPSEAIGKWLTWNLMKVGYKLIRINERIEKVGK